MGGGAQGVNDLASTILSAGAASMSVAGGSPSQPQAVLSDEQRHLNRIREAQMKQEKIYQQHLARFVLPQSLHKIMDEAKTNNKVDSEYQNEMQRHNANLFQRQQQRNQYYQGLKQAMDMRGI